VHLGSGVKDRTSAPQRRSAERLADTFRASRAVWMRPERGPDVVEMRWTEMKQAIYLRLCGVSVPVSRNGLGSYATS
jgi:hypothetical protein